MKKYLRIVSIYVLILFSGILFLSSSVTAAKYLPYLDFVGDFEYCDGDTKGAAWCTSTEGNKPALSEPFNYSLNFYGMDVTMLWYSNNTWISDAANPEGYDHDPVLDAHIEIGTLYNDDYPDNLTFGDTQPSGGSTGPVTFEVTDGTYTFYTAYLDFVQIQGPDIFGTNLNRAYDADNVTNITFDPDNDAPYSRYMDELEASIDNGAALNFRYNFTFTLPDTSVPSDFTADAGGPGGGDGAPAHARAAGGRRIPLSDEL